MHQWVAGIVTAGLVGFCGVAHADNSNDAEEIRAAILNFAEGCYAGDADQVARAFHPDLDKGGFGRRPDGSWIMGVHSYRGIIDECETLYTERLTLPPDPRAEIIIYEVLEQTASAKLTAEWGIDYFHLGKYDGRWLIKNSLGQSHPEE